MATWLAVDQIKRQRHIGAAREEAQGAGALDSRDPQVRSACVPRPLSSPKGSHPKTQQMVGID